MTARRGGEQDRDLRPDRGGEFPDPSVAGTHLGRPVIIPPTERTWRPGKAWSAPAVAMTSRFGLHVRRPVTTSAPGRGKDFDGVGQLSSLRSVAMEGSLST
jgi:hypothetical protein